MRLLHPVSAERDHSCHFHFQHECDGDDDGGGDGCGCACDVSLRRIPMRIKRCRIASCGSACGGGDDTFDDCLPCVMKKLLWMWRLDVVGGDREPWIGSWGVRC
jgi:hypothetical protein